MGELSLQWEYREKGLILERALTPFWETNEILHFLQFGPGAELPNHRIKLNSCSVYLVDIKKEKPFFNSELEKQTQTRTNCNPAFDIIGKTD